MESERDFSSQFIDDFLRDDLRHLVRLAIREDLGRGVDLTTVSIVPEVLEARADVVARVAGVAAGCDLVESIVETIGADIRVDLLCRDGDRFESGQSLLVLHGQARDVLTCERTVLNFLGRLCGIASWTRQHADAIGKFAARIYDTRKTTPGWRRLEKYAVRCGGGHNHRSGLHDAILIKDNHLACHARVGGQLLRPSEAVAMARQFLSHQTDGSQTAIVEIEVDSLEQLADALEGAADLTRGAMPDIVLLDNMSLEELTCAVAMRNEIAPGVQLEASGGVNLSTLPAIAATGVDRISIGALTHSAINLDLGLDWDLGQTA